MIRLRVLGAATALTMLATVAAGPGAVAASGCAPASHAGGEWRRYGGTADNARNQPAETTIGPANASSLTTEFVFNASQAAPSGGGFSNTPVVADGCLYLATNTGWVFAVNADDGVLQWRTKLSGGGQTLLGGVIVGSVAVANGIVFAGVSRPGSPYVAALDQATGAILWFSTVDTIASSGINASPVYYEANGVPLVFQGFFGNEGTSLARGGYAIIDAVADCTGCPVVDGVPQKAPRATAYTINDADYARGYRGASVWTTAAADDDGYLYAGGGNPASKKLEHKYSNALLKIDGDPSRPTFGSIVAAFKGNQDNYVPGLNRQPLCDLFGDDIVFVWSFACLQLDLDFGASPNLFDDGHGNLMVGALQKSGVYYALHADQMLLEWSTIVGAPCAACNASSSAFDTSGIYIAATPGGHMVSLEQGQGRYRWASPIGDSIHFQPVSVANGVAYTLDGYGTLRGYDTATGAPVVSRPLSADVNNFATDFGGSAGLSIARNMIYVAAGSYVVAYKGA